MRENYPAPLAANSKADGFSIRLSGGEDVQKRLAAVAPLIEARIVRVLEVLGQQLAAAAAAEAPKGKNKKGHRGGYLRKSFGVYARTAWKKFGVIGVAVRSRAKYHHYVEFGVNRPNTQVVLHRDIHGRKVRAGQGEGRRYREGTNKLNPGVFAKSYRRNIHQAANPVLGRSFRRMESHLVSSAEMAVRRLLSGTLPTSSEAA